MFLLHNGIYINYEIEGKGRPVICLHGWGTNNTSFDKQIEYFKDNYCFYKIDLPGFGLSDEPKTVYNLDNYVEVIEKLTKIEKIEVENVENAEKIAGKIQEEIQTCENDAEIEVDVIKENIVKNSNNSKTEIAELLTILLEKINNL